MTGSDQPSPVKSRVSSNLAYELLRTVKITACVRTGSIVTIDVDYLVPIDLKFYTLMLHFTPSAENRQI